MGALRTVILAAAASGFALGAAGALADEALYNAKLCETCHGPEGRTPILPTYPKLAGQNSPYCQQQVKDIRDGVRTNGLAAAMKPLVRALTDDEITKLCDYLSAL